MRANAPNIFRSLFVTDSQRIRQYMHSMGWSAERQEKAIAFLVREEMAPLRLRNADYDTWSAVTRAICDRFRKQMNSAA